MTLIDTRTPNPKSFIKGATGDWEIVIGMEVHAQVTSESKLFSLSGSSLVVAPFKDEQRKIVGVLGVIGPTRLNYARIIPMVDFTAKLVGRLLP